MGPEDGCDVCGEKEGNLTYYGSHPLCETCQAKVEKFIARLKTRQVKL